MGQLIDRTTLLNSGFNLALCGIPISDPTFGDAFHVGIYYNHKGHQYVIHYDGPICYQSIHHPDFGNYLFNPIDNFPHTLLGFVHSLAQAVAGNKLNNFKFRRSGIPYNGEGFAMNTGNFSQTPTTNFPINCGVFVVAFMKSSRFPILNWMSWPPYQLTGNELKTWLITKRIPRSEWVAHHNYLQRNIRGKDILAAPSCPFLPANENYSARFGDYLIWLIFNRYP